MGTFEVQIQIGRPQYEPPSGLATDVEPSGYPGAADWLETVTAVVDTGATHTILPTSLLEYLHIEPFPHKVQVTLGDNSIQEWALGMARIVYGSYDMPCYVIFGSEDVYLLGATTLEAFGLTVDPIDPVLAPKIIRGRPF